MKIRAKLKEFWAKAKRKLVMAAASAAAIASPAAAATNGTTVSVNWTQLSELIAGAAQIMPGIGVLITSVVGPLLILIVVGFVVGIFDSLIGAIRDAFRFFR